MQLAQDEATERDRRIGALESGISTLLMGGGPQPPKPQTAPGGSVRRTEVVKLKSRADEQVPPTSPCD